MRQQLLSLSLLRAITSFGNSFLFLMLNFCWLSSWLNSACAPARLSFERRCKSTVVAKKRYGHYIQSQNFGISYLSRYGIPSGLNCMGHKKHKYHPAEQDANIRAFKYFNKYIDNYTGWKFGVNPIGGYDNSQPYDDSQNQAVLNNGLLRPAWYNYIFPGEILITGFINWLSLENYEEH